MRTLSPDVDDPDSDDVDAALMGIPSAGEALGVASLVKELLWSPCWLITGEPGPGGVACPTTSAFNMVSSTGLATVGVGVGVDDNDAYDELLGLRRSTFSGVF